MTIEPLETTTRTEIHLPGFAKLEFSAGSQGAQVWTEELERRIGNIRNSQAKSELLQIIRSGKHYEIAWRNEQQVRALFPHLDDTQIAATIEASNKISARELVEQDVVRIAVNAFLYTMMGKSSLEILMNDEAYNHNDLNEKDPTVAWSRIMATHITERDGSGTQKQYTALNTMITEFASIRQDGETETITEYMRRYERAEKTLMNAGFDVKSQWLDSEEKRVVKFLYSLDQVKFGRLIRDVANMVVAIPDSIQDLIKVAKDRKEVVATTQKRSVLATTVHTDDPHNADVVSRKETKTAAMGKRTAVLATAHHGSATTDADNKRDPLVPYPRYSPEEWAKFTAAERTNISKHNANIRKAAAGLPQRPHDSIVRPRKQKPKVNTALITTNSESDDSDFDTNIVLFTSLPNRGQSDESDREDDDSDMPPLLDMSDDEEELVQTNNPPNGRTPTLNPEEVHQTPTRGINVTDNIVSPERGSRDTPPVNTLSRVIGCKKPCTATPSSIASE